MTFFPTIVEGPGSDGGYCAIVAGTGILGQGDSVIEALEDAAASLQEVIDDFASSGRPLPTPGNPDDEDAHGLVTVLPARIPAHAA